MLDEDTKNDIIKSAFSVINDENVKETINCITDPYKVKFVYSFYIILFLLLLILFVCCFNLSFLIWKFGNSNRTILS